MTNDLSDSDLQSISLPDLTQEQNASRWFVYLIRTKENTLYCGVTTDMQRRFEQHGSGKGAKALRGKGPLTLVWYSVAGESRSEAQKWEHRIKKLPKRRKESLVSGLLSLETLI